MQRFVVFALLALGAGCGSATVGDSCVAVTAAGPLTVASSYAGHGCDAFTPAVVARVEDFLHWRPVALSGWTVEVVSAASMGGHHGGMTYSAQRLMQVEAQSVGLRVLVHELEHARLGPDSENHCGWTGFAAWELQETGLDEAGYDAASCAEASGEQ